MSKSKYEFKRNFAIIIGINEYSNGIPPLLTPIADARKLAQLLQDNYKYEVLLLLDSQANLEGLNNLLENFKQKTLPLQNETVQVQENDRVLFYFAGHGIVPVDGLENKGDAVGYLVPQDARGDILLQEELEIDKVLLPMQALHDGLAELPCRHMLVILDCCFAGAFRSSLYRDIVPARKVYKQRFDRFIQDKAWQALASAAHDQKAIDYLGCFGQRGNIDGNSPFATALFEGLRGAADTTLRSGDGIITATELYCYVRDKVEELTQEHNRRQTPGLFQLKKHDKGEYIFLLPNFDQKKLEDAPALNPENNPYRGLSSYEEEHSQLFFGRDKLVKELFERIDKSNNPLTVVLGASGSGKSSLVKAGLIPYLKNEHAFKWYIIPTIRPGESPFTALAESVLAITDVASASKLDAINTLSESLKQTPENLINVIANWRRANPDIKLLLVIDQFEELITMCKQQEREMFLNLLAQVLENSQQLCLLLTLRADFEPRFLDSALQRYWSGARFPVRAMSSHELRQAIERPASEKMLDFDPPNLVDLLIDEVGQMPGALSLLSFTLSELYIKCIKRESRTLSKADYDALGGVAGSLTHRATEEYSKLDAAQQVTMRRVMLRMVTIEGGESARRRVPLSELVYALEAENKRVEEVVRRLAEARLIVGGRETAGEAYVEPAHDALVRGWEKLQEWKKEEEENLALQQRLTPAANDWANGKGMLWIEEADRLAKLEKLLDTDNWLNKLETEFAKRSIGERKDRIKKLEEDLRISEERRARAEIREKASRVENLLQVQPSEGLLLAIEAMGQNLNELPEEILAPVQTSLHRAMEIGRLSIPFWGHEYHVNAVNFSPDGQMIVSGSSDDTVRLWDLQGNCIGQPFMGHEGSVTSVAFSPDGQIIVSGSSDNTVRLWDLQGNPIGQPFVGHEGSVTSVTFSPNGQIIVSGSSDNTVRLWDLQGNSIGQPFVEHEDSVTSVAFSPDGQMIVSGSHDNTVRLWDLQGNSIGQPFVGHRNYVSCVAFSPDGQMIVSSSSDSTVRLWNIQGNLIGQPFDGHQGASVYAVAFSPDGHMIASGSGSYVTNNIICLWNLQGQLMGQPLIGHESVVSSVAFSLDGEMIVSGSTDNTVRLWDLRNNSISQPFQGHEGEVDAVVFSPDAKMIVSGSRDRTVRLWNLKGKLISQPFIGHESEVTAIAFSPKGEIIASGSGDNTVRLWNLQSNPIGQPFIGHEKWVSSVTFSPNGEIIASGSGDNTVRLWNLQGNPIGQPFFGHEEPVRSVAFSPNGQMIVSGSADQTLRLWDLQGNSIGKPFIGHEGQVNSVAFSPDGQMIVSGGGILDDDTVRLWDLQGNPISQPFLGHEGPVISVAFSPDGRMIISSSGDNTVRLWDLQGNQISQPFVGHEGPVVSVAFSPDGQMVVTGSNDKTVRLWRGGGWRAWLEVCCHRLRYHPVFKNPEKGSIEEAACETCKKYVWNKNEASTLIK